MNKLFIVLIMFTTIISNKTIAQSKDELNISAAIEALRKAMVDADSVALDKLTSNNLTYGHSDGKVQTKAEFIRSLISGESDFVTIDLGDQTIKVYDKTAIVRHILNANTNNNNKPGTVKLTILTVWYKEHDKWKLLARQAVRLS